MTDEDILARLTVIFRQVFESPDVTATPGMTAKEVPRWDSLSHIDMIVSVEEAFGVRLPTREVAGMQNVADLVRCIRAKLG